MKRSKLNEQQIAFILRQAKARKIGIQALLDGEEDYLLANLVDPASCQSFPADIGLDLLGDKQCEEVREESGLIHGRGHSPRAFARRRVGMHFGKQHARQMAKKTGLMPVPSTGSL